MISIGSLAAKSKTYAMPDSRAAMLGHAGLDYYRASVLANWYQWRDNGLPMFHFLFPTMHQAIELISKGIAYKAIPGFDSKTFSHRTLSLMQAHAHDVPVFATVLQDSKNIELLEGLEKSYLGVRYGECYQSSDGSAWPRFVELSEQLFDDLSARTGLRFPYGVSGRPHGLDTFSSAST